MRPEPSGRALQVDFTTLPGSAEEGIDYTPVSGTLTWPDGDATARVIEVPLAPADGQPQRELTVLLSNVQGATVAADTATVTIQASAAPAPPAPPPPAPPPAAPRSGGMGIEWLIAAALLHWIRRREQRITAARAANTHG